MRRMTRWDLEIQPWEEIERWLQNLPALFQAVMIQALADLQAKEKKTPKENSLPARECARRWMLSTSRGGIFSFEQVCIQLDLDPTAVRMAMARFLCPALAQGWVRPKKTVRQLARRRRTHSFKDHNPKRSAK